jgi:hypothetical protein
MSPASSHGFADVTMRDAEANSGHLPGSIFLTQRPDGPLQGAQIDVDTLAS